MKSTAYRHTRKMGLPKMTQGVRATLVRCGITSYAVACCFHSLSCVYNASHKAIQWPTTPIHQIEQSCCFARSKEKQVCPITIPAERTWRL